MNTQNPYTARVGGGRDMLGYTPEATPPADAWIAAFAKDFAEHGDGARAVEALMSSLRLFTAEFVAEIGALPPVESRLPPIRSNIAQAIYTLTGPMIVEVYQKQISRKAGRGAIEAAFTEAMPRLLARYSGPPAPSNTNGS